MTRLLLVLGLVGAASAAELVTMDSRAVVAWPALVLRDAPAADAGALCSLPFGEVVAVVSSADAGARVSVGGVAGHWRQVHWGAQQGWMFDAWLLPLPAPPASCGGLESWVARWSPQGVELSEWLEDPATGEPFLQLVQDYQGGLQRVSPQLPGGPRGVLWLPGTSLHQAWFVARRCHPGLGPLAESNWPPAGAGALSVRYTADRLEVSDPQGVVLLELEREDDGVWLAWR